MRNAKPTRPRSQDGPVINPEHTFSEKIDAAANGFSIIDRTLSAVGLSIKATGFVPDPQNRRFKLS